MIREYTLKEKLTEGEQSSLRCMVGHKALMVNGKITTDDEVYHIGLMPMSVSWKEATVIEQSAYLAQAEVKPKTLREEVAELKARVAINTTKIDTITKIMEVPIEN